MRRIGTLNCGHSAFPIILGVNAPQYTDEELERFRKENEEGITIAGKHYTLYQATQKQRKFERAIRKQRHRILVDEALNDKNQLQTDQIKLIRLQEEYVRFSKAAKLPVDHARMEVAGFNWKQAKAAESTVRAVEQEQIRLAKLKEEEYNKRRNEALARIRSDEFPKTLNRGNQEKHILGAPGRIEGRSYIHGDLTTAQELVFSYFGKGEPTFNRKGEWNQKEIVLADHIIGVNVEIDTGEESETKRFVIHYGKKGAHIVPTKELEK